jgi:hypothetical protein
LRNYKEQESNLILPENDDDDNVPPVIQEIIMYGTFG